VDFKQWCYEYGVISNLNIKDLEKCWNAATKEAYLKIASDYRNVTEQIRFTPADVAIWCETEAAIID